MSTWQVECKQHLQKLISTEPALDHIGRALESRNSQLHLAIFVEPYLTFILEGKKTVESRFSCVRCAPYDRVKTGDVILLKRAGGPVAGLCCVNSAWFYELDRKTLGEIRREFSDQICPAESGFWTSREGRSFATLISLTDVERVPEFSVSKRDRRGWVTI